MADTDKLLRIIKNTDLENNQIIQKLVKTAAATDNQQLQNRIQKLIETRAAHEIEYPFTQPKTPSQWQNTVKLGYTPTGSTYTVQESDLTKHLLAAGQTGAGKTTLFLNLKDQLSVPWWSFDFKKDYRHLSKQRDDVTVLTPKQIKLDPLQPPPGRTLSEWLSSFVETFCDSQMLLGGSERFLDKHATHYINSNDDVSLLGLKNYIENLSVHPSQQQFQKRVADSIGSIIRDLPGLTGTTENTLNLEELLQHRVVLELDEQKSKTQNFVVEHLMTWVYEYRKGQNQRTGDLRHVFFIDESKEIFSVYKERNTASGNPVIALKLAKMREFGEGVVAADQEAAKLMDSLKANTRTKVMLPAGDRREFEALAESLHLNEMQESWAQNLDIGQAIIQVGNNEPVPVLLDDFELEKDVDDQTLEELQRNRWMNLLSPDSSTAETGNGETDESSNTGYGSESVEHEISEGEYRLLKDIAENPFKTASERYELFSSTGKGSRIKSNLVDKNLIEEATVSKGKTRLTLFEFTDSGREYVEKQDFNIHRAGRGGVEHRYWQHQLKYWLEDCGWIAELEKLDADVLGRKQDTRVAVEVAMGNNQREVDHVEKHLAEGIDHVLIGARNKSVAEDLRRRIAETGSESDTVQVQRLHEIIDREKAMRGS